MNNLVMAITLLQFYIQRISNMTRELQELIKETIAHQKGQKYPCSNQVVCNMIILRDSSRIDAFEQAYPHFICYRYAKDVRNRKYFDPYTETKWQVVTLTEHARGYRYYRAIIDSTIDDGIMHLIAMPQMALYCCKVDFFD